MTMNYIPLRLKKEKNIIDRSKLLFISIVVFVGYVLTLQGGHEFYVTHFTTIKSIEKPNKLIYSEEVENKLKNEIKTAKNEKILQLKNEIKSYKKELKAIPNYSDFLNEALSIREKNYDNYIAIYMTPYLKKYKKSTGVRVVKSTKKLKNREEIRAIIDPIFRYIYSIKYTSKREKIEANIKDKEDEIINIKTDNTHLFDSKKEVLNKASKEYINKYNEEIEAKYLAKIEAQKSKYKTSYLSIIAWSVLAFILIEILILGESIKVLNVKGTLADEVEKLNKKLSSCNNLKQIISDNKDYIAELEAENNKLLDSYNLLSELKLNPLGTEIGQKIKAIVLKDLSERSISVQRVRDRDMEVSQKSFHKDLTSVPLEKKSYGTLYIPSGTKEIDFKQLNENRKISLIKEILLNSSNISELGELKNNNAFLECDFFNIGKNLIKKLVSKARSELVEDGLIIQGQHKKYFLKRV